MLRSTGFRLFGVGLLTLFMFIPLFFAAIIIEDRGDHARSTINSISREWGGSQQLVGPYFRVPVSGPVTRLENRERVDPATGETVITQVSVTNVEPKRPLYILPDAYQAAISTTSEERQRGIFRVPVYTASAEIDFTFDQTAVAGFVDSDETLHWEDAEVVIGVSDNRSLRGAAELRVDGAMVPLSPRGTTALPNTYATRETVSIAPTYTSSGITAQIGDPREVTEFNLILGFNGAQNLTLAPVGRTTSLSMTSDWAHPSFTGAFLPDERSVDDTGFTAQWTIPHLARGLPQIGRSEPDQNAGSLGFGVRFYQPNDFYQKAFRAARHSILFIALTFLTVFLIENRAERPVHPVQYILIGLAQCVFVVMMTAYSEQIGFDLAYALSAGATILLLTMFGATGLKLGVRTWVLAAMLIVIYTVLYFILQSTDYALLAGSTLAFAALAGTIYATRNEKWYREPDPNRPSLLDRMRPAAAPDPQPNQSK